MESKPIGHIMIHTHRSFKKVGEGNGYEMSWKGFWGLLENLIYN